jgi:phospholipid N-methyltransferase
MLTKLIEPSISLFRLADALASSEAITFNSDIYILIFSGVIGVISKRILKRGDPDDPVREMCITIAVFQLLHLMRYFTEMQSAVPQGMISGSQFMVIFTFLIGVEKKKD